MPKGRPYKMCKDIQPIAQKCSLGLCSRCSYRNQKGCKKAAEAAEAIGEGLQSFCYPGSVAADRKVGLGQETWLPCYSVKKPNALHSLLDTNLSLRQKVPSVSQNQQTKYVNNR